MKNIRNHKSSQEQLTTLTNRFSDFLLDFDVPSSGKCRVEMKGDKSNEKVAGSFKVYAAAKDLQTTGLLVNITRPMVWFIMVIWYMSVHGQCIYSWMHKYNEALKCGDPVCPHALWIHIPYWSFGAVQSRKGLVALIQHPPAFWWSKLNLDPCLVGWTRFDYPLVGGCLFAFQLFTQENGMRNPNWWAYVEQRGWLNQQPVATSVFFSFFFFGGGNRWLSTCV